MNIDLSQLDMSLNAGVGNVMAGAFAFKGFSARKDAMSEMKIFNLAELDRKPRLLRKPSIKYPATLKRQKVEGDVKLLVLINERGSGKVQVNIRGLPRRRNRSIFAYQQREP